MATLISDFYEPIRFILGDRDSTVRLYDDSAISAGVRSSIKMNYLPGFTLTGDLLSVTPDVSDPNDYALLVLKIARSFVAPNPSRYSYKTRAISESFGDYKQFIAMLDESLHELENGVMFAGWQMFKGWWEGMFGVSLVSVLTQVNVKAPWRTLTIAQGSAEVDDEEARMQDDILFTNVGTLIAGQVFLGEYQAPRKAALTRAVMNCRAPNAPVTLGCFINGVEDGSLAFAITSGQSRIETGFDRVIAQNDRVTWRCTAAPVIDLSASEASINMHVERRDG